MLALLVASNACRHSDAAPAAPAHEAPLPRALVVSTSVSAVESVAFSSSGAGTVVGRVVLDGTPPPMPRRTVRIDAALCGDDPREDRSFVVNPATKAIRFAVVTLTPRNGAAPATPPTQVPAIDQAKCEFYPYITLVRPGGSVTVVNSDPGLHDLHRLEPGGPGSHDASPPGSRLPLTFHRAGRTHVVCDLHYWSSAWVIATDAPFAAVTDGDGAFAFRGVPAGAWTLSVWQERLGEQSIELNLAANQTLKPVLAMPLAKPSPAPSPSAPAR